MVEVHGDAFAGAVGGTVRDPAVRIQEEIDGVRAFGAPESQTRVVVD